MRQETLIDTTSPVTQLSRPSPKLKAVELIGQSFINLTFKIPVLSSNINATNFMAHQIPYPDPDLRNLASNFTFNNEQFIQVQTPKTANTTTFEAAPLMQLNITQSKIPSSVTLRLKNIINGYSIRSFDVLV